MSYEYDKEGSVSDHESLRTPRPPGSVEESDRDSVRTRLASVAPDLFSDVLASRDVASLNAAISAVTPVAARSTAVSILVDDFLVHERRRSATSSSSSGRDRAEFSSSLSRVPHAANALLYWSAACGHAHRVVQLCEVCGADPAWDKGGGRTAAWTAANNGHTRVLEVVVRECGTEIRSKPGGLSPLNTASLKGHLDAVRFLLREASVVDETPDAVGMLALHAAAQGGHVEVLRELIRARAREWNDDPVELARYSAARTKNTGTTPLHIAALKGHLGAVEVLVELCGADARDRKDNGTGSVFLSAQGGHRGVVEYLIDDAGADPNEANARGTTAMYIAAQNGHVGTVTSLCERGADASAANSEGWTPILTAAQHGHLDVVRVLVDTGGVDADATLQAPRRGGTGDGDGDGSGVGQGADGQDDNHGTTPVLLAAQDGHIELVQWLIEHGIPQSAPGGVVTATTLASVLFRACMNDRERVIAVVLDRVVPAEAEGDPVLFSRAIGGLVESKSAVVRERLLISALRLGDMKWRGASVARMLLLGDVAGDLNLDARDSNGTPPLLCTHPRDPLSVDLGEHGANVLTVSPPSHNASWGATDLHAFAWQFPYKKTSHEMYLTDTDDIDSRQDASARTPLHHAAVMARPEWVRALLDRGADPLASDNAGFNALHHAMSLPADYGDLAGGADDRRVVICEILQHQGNGGRQGAGGAFSSSAVGRQCAQSRSRDGRLPVDVALCAAASLIERRPFLQKLKRCDFSNPPRTEESLAFAKLASDVGDACSGSERTGSGDGDAGPSRRHGTEVPATPTSTARKLGRVGLLAAICVLLSPIAPFALGMTALASGKGVMAMAAEAAHRLGTPSMGSLARLWIAALGACIATVGIAAFVPHVLVGPADADSLAADDYAARGHAWQLVFLLGIVVPTLLATVGAALARQLIHAKRPSGRAMFTVPVLPDGAVSGEHRNTEDASAMAENTFLCWTLSPKGTRQLAKAKVGVQVVLQIISGIQHVALAFIPDSAWNEEDPASSWVPNTVVFFAGRITSAFELSYAGSLAAGILLACGALAFASFVVLAFIASAVREPWRERGLSAACARAFPFLTREFMSRVPGGTVGLSLLTSTVFVFVLGNLLATIDCTRVGATGAWVLDGTGGSGAPVECWKGAHAARASAAMCVFVPYTITSFVLQLMLLRAYKDDDLLRTTGAYLLFSLSVQVVGTALATLLDGTAYIPLLWNAMCEIALWIFVTFVHDPVPGFPRTRGIMAGGHGASWVAHAAAITSLAIGTRESLVPMVIYVALVPVVVLTGFFLAARKRHHQVEG